MSELLREKIDEFSEWEAPFVEPGRSAHCSTTKHPPIDSPGGLPDGWRLVATMPKVTGEDMFLVVRVGGGAFIMRRSEAKKNTKTAWFFETIGDMYDGLRFKRDGGVSEWGLRERPSPLLAPIVAWLERVMTGLYDMTDPVEAAEPVLLALGAPFTIVPKGAYAIPLPAPADC